MFFFCVCVLRIAKCQSSVDPREQWLSKSPDIEETYFFGETRRFLRRYHVTNKNVVTFGVRTHAAFKLLGKLCGIKRAQNAGHERSRTVADLAVIVLRLRPLFLLFVFLSFQRV